MSRRMWETFKADPLKWVSAAGAIVATASAEYEIARAVGMHEAVACAVPVALDAYVLRALAAHREVFTAVAAMIAVNAGSHLVTAGVLDIGWALITAVSAIAPLVLWRVHALGRPSMPEHVEHEESTRACVCGDSIEWMDGDGGGWIHSPGSDTECLEACPVEEYISRTRAQPSSTPEHVEHVEHEPSTLPVTCFCGATVWGDLGAHQRRPGHGSNTSEHNRFPGVPGMPLADVLPFNVTEHEPSTPEAQSTRVLQVVPALPAEYEDVLLPEARVLDKEARWEHGKHVTVNKLKAVLHVGTPRAQAIRDVLRAEHERNEGSTS